MKDEKKVDLVRVAQKTASPQQQQFWHEVGERLVGKDAVVKPRPERKK